MNGPDCIFCKIAAGVVPCEKVFEDHAALAFMDIAPLAPGHVLLMPKGHYETLDTMPEGIAGDVLRSLPTLVRAVQAATACAGVNILQNNGQVAHQLVPHVHIHIIPRNAGDEFHFNWPAGNYPPGRMAQLAAEIRKGLA